MHHPQAQGRQVLTCASAQRWFNTQSTTLLMPALWKASISLRKSAAVPYLESRASSFLGMYPATGAPNLSLSLFGT